MSAETNQPAAGSILDGYRLLEAVGSGSCGTVFRAKNLLSGEIFALKIFPEQGSLSARELQAVKLYQKIEHPNLIRIHHVGQADRMLFYTMDWCESSLTRKKVPPDELLTIARKLADALAVLHEHGLIHRDIKPDNLLFRDGEIVLGDIGLVTRQENATFAGSPGFLAPALLCGQSMPDAYSDCYALAKSLYCALSGLPPGKYPLYTGTLSPAASILMRAVMAVCSKEPQIRNAPELLVFLDSGKLPAPPVRPSKFRKWLLPGSFSAVLLIAAAAGAVLFLQSTPETENKKKSHSEAIPAARMDKAKAESNGKAQPEIYDSSPPRLIRRWSEMADGERRAELDRRSREYGRLNAGTEITMEEWFEYLEKLKKYSASHSYREEYARFQREMQKKIEKLQQTATPEVQKAARRQMEESAELHAELCTSGVGADPYYLVRDPEMMLLWKQIGIEWESRRKWDFLKELLHREEENGKSAGENLLRLAKNDRFVQFFGIDQRQWLKIRNNARLVRNRSDAKLQKEYQLAAERYKQQTVDFLNWYRKTGKASAVR